MESCIVLPSPARGLVPPTSDLQGRCTWRHKCRGRHDCRDAGGRATHGAVAEDAGSDWRECNRIVGNNPCLGGRISIIKTSSFSDLWYSLLVSVTELCFHFLFCLPRHSRQLNTTKISILHHPNVAGGVVPLFALVVCCVLLNLNVRRFAVYSI